MANQTLQERQKGNGAEAAESQQRQGQYYRPNVDLIEKADELLVQADIPGATREGIDIEFENGSLTIHAKVPDAGRKTRATCCGNLASAISIARFA